MPEQRYVPLHVDLLVCAVVTLAVAWVTVRTGLAMAIYRPMEAMNPGGAMSFLAVLATPIGVFLHELGHWITARRFVDGDVGMSVGPLSGSVHYEAGRLTLEQHVLVILSGPLMSGVAVLAGLAALPHFEQGSLVHAVLYGTTGASIVGVLNLIPFRFRLESGSGSELVVSDGRQLFEALFAFWALRRR